MPDSYHLNSKRDPVPAGRSPAGASIVVFSDSSSRRLPFIRIRNPGVAALLPASGAMPVLSGPCATGQAQALPVLPAIACIFFDALACGHLRNRPMRGTNRRATLRSRAPGVRVLVILLYLYESIAVVVEGGVLCGQACFVQWWRGLAGCRTLCGGVHKACTPAYNNFARAPPAVDNHAVVPELRTELSTAGAMVGWWGGVSGRPAALVRALSGAHAKRSGTPFGSAGPQESALPDGLPGPCAVGVVTSGQVPVLALPAPWGRRACHCRASRHPGCRAVRGPRRRGVRPCRAWQGDHGGGAGRQRSFAAQA